MRYDERVAELVAEGMCNGDAQAVADAEELGGVVFDPVVNDTEYGVRVFVGECALFVLGV